MKLTERTSGVLLHLSSLPGPAFCGDLGESARNFADFLHTAGQTWWQMLPINPIDSHFSPYASVSAFAGEPLYLDLVDLMQDGLLEPGDIDWEPTGPLEQTAFQAARDYRRIRWHKAFHHFRSGKEGKKYHAAYEPFMEQNGEWVTHHALFCSIAEQFGTYHWGLWPDEKIRQADPEVLKQFSRVKEERISYHIFLQLLFHVQWSAFRDYCHDKGIGLIGDVPIYVGLASADTWGYSKLFQMDKHGRMERTAGVPADSFNPDGQRWNSPLFRWEAHHEENYRWWTSRIRTCFSRFDVVRLDHFIGFYNYFSMPEISSTEDHGFWASGPADDFFDAILTEFPRTAFIAEDLGVMNPGVHALRDKYEFPGMNVYQFCFDFRRNIDPAVEWKSNSVVCSGTHDTMTLAAWFDDVIADRVKPEPFWDFPSMVASLKHFVPGTESWAARLAEMTPERARRLRNAKFPFEPGIHRDSLRWAILQTIMNSPGNTAIFPMQDLLGLGKDARMNFPGHTGHNWVWRLHPKSLTQELALAMNDLAFAYQR